MLQFPLRCGFEIVADLQFIDLPDPWSPRQSRDDPTATGEGIEVHVMLARPEVRGGIAEKGFFVGDVGVFERELTDAAGAELADVPFHVGLRFDKVSRHYAGGSNRQRSGGGKELIESRRIVTHQLAAALVVVVMPGIAEVTQAGVGQAVGKFSRKARAVREAGDLVEISLASADQADDLQRPQERFAAASDHQARSATFGREFVVGLDVQLIPRGRFAPQRTD